jgi:hypothetical protein
MMPRTTRCAEVACIRRLLWRCGLQWGCARGIDCRASECQGNREQSCSDPPRHERPPTKSRLRCWIARAKADGANAFRTASSVTHLAMAIIVYRAPALVVSAALIGAARQRLP